MGNSHSVPSGNRERLSDRFRRLFRDKSNMDKLVDRTFEEKQKPQKKRGMKGKGIWKRIKKRVKADDKTAEKQDSSEAFQRRQTECQQIENDCETQLDEDTQLKECSNRTGTNPKKNVLPRAQDGDVAFDILSVDVPFQAVCNSKSPTFQCNVPPKFDWRMENSNRRDVQYSCSFCSHKGCSSDVWFDDNLANITCTSDEDSEDENFGKWSETGNDVKMPSAIKEINGLKECKNIEIHINNAIEKTALQFSELQVSKEGLNDIKNKLKECDDALKEQCLPSQLNSDIEKKTQHIRNKVSHESLPAVSLSYCRDKDPNTSRHFDPKEANISYDDTHFISCKNRELFAPGSGYSNKDKMDPENTLNFHQVLDFDTFFIGRDVKSSDLGLTRIERYLAAQNHDGDERASTSLERKSPMLERKSYDMPLVDVPDTNALAQDNTPVLQINTQVGSGLTKDHLPPVLEVIAQPKCISHEINLAPMLELSTHPKCVSHEIPISLVIEITAQQKCAEIKNERTGDKDCSCIRAFKQCNNSELESVTCQPNTEHLDSTNDTDTNVHLAVSPVSFESEKINDEKENANKVSQCTQTDNDFVSDNVSNNDMNEDKHLERNVQTKDTTCIDTENDGTSENKDKKENLKDKEYPLTNIKTDEVLFALITGSTDTDTDAKNIKTNLEKELQNKVNQLNKAIIESKSRSDCKIENEETQTNSTEENNNLERAVIKNKKAEAFFVSFGPSVTNNVSPDKLKTDFVKKFPNKIKETFKMKKNEQSMDVARDDTGYPSELDRVEASCENISTTFPEKETEITGIETKYDSLQDHVQAKEESLLKKQELEQFQTEGNLLEMDSRNENCLYASDLGQYGSVSHNGSIQENSVFKTQILQSMKTKEHSWKTNEEDSCLETNTSMKNYVVAPKTAQYGSVEHNNKMKHDNILQKEKINNIQTTLDTWKTKEADNSYLQPKIKTHISAPKQAEYGSIKHFNDIKKDNALRKIRISEIRSNLDSWGASNPGSKYSLQRKDEWEPVMDHKKFGTAAHFHQIKDDNAMRQRRLSKIRSNIDSWNTPNPGSKYSLQRKDEWEPVMDHKKFGTAAHFHQIKDDNAIRQRRLSKIRSNIDSWNTPNPGSKYSLQRKDEWEPVMDHKKFGTAAHFHQIKDDNAMRQRRLSKIRSNIDSWNTPNPGSKYSLQRKDEWEPVMDHKKFGTAAHFHQIKDDNAMRQRRLSKIKSNVDTWNTPNPGSKYSLQRKDEWEPVLDTKKYGSVAHYHQVRETNTEKRYQIQKAVTKLNTWQPKNKMNLLRTQRQNETNDLVKIPNVSWKSGRPQEELSVNSSPKNSHRLSSWSRHDSGISKQNRSYIPVRKVDRSYRNVMPGATSGQF